ncbi:glycosyltransferase [Clostridium sp. MSJ-8]|uniref:glycosyltransferase family 2 protein n=1 Tax=Clostridium sp. MSJ-8 TaxID=2841510 RepID=UPI001C0ECD43|nr:glycosyltransferase family 2 protein [Clostridium sp. MSJ-8]MBU5487101.1 glycosyltransferase [Clostridium sp. MSJ-8]
MKISIIVPVYNNAKYISKCIESIISQKFSNWELILVNGGSQDKTKEICEKYAHKDERIILINTINEGPSGARNIGLDYAHGEYCMFVDGDDYIEQDTLKILADEIKEKDYQIIFYGNYNDILNDGKYTIKNENVSKECAFNDNSEFQKVYKDLLDNHLVNQVWNKIYKKSFIDEVGARFPKGINYSEDLIFNIKLYKKLQSGMVIDKALYHYVNHEKDSLCTTFNINKFNDMKYAYVKVWGFVNDWNEGLKQYINNWFVKNINIYINSLFNSSCQLNYSQKRDILENIIKDDVVQECISSNSAIGLRNKITTFIIRNKLTSIALLMGRVTRIIRKR